MRKRILPFAFLFLIVFPSLLFAQEQIGLRQKADEFYESASYAKAAAIYERLAKNNKRDADLLVHLANSYRLMNNYEQAKKWFQTLQYTKLLPIPELLNYAEVMRNSSEFDEARDLLKEYELINGKNPYLTILINGCDSAKAWSNDPSALIKVKRVDTLNTDKSEWGAIAINDSVVVFTAERAPIFVDKKQGLYGRTGQPFLGVYERKLNSSSEKTIPFDQQFIVSDYHTGPLAINEKRDLMFVTRTYINSKVYKEVSNGRVSSIRRLELWYTEKKDGKWSDLQPFPYNAPERYSVGHAALTKDGKTLYFVSDMPGTKGKTDIWYCSKLPSGKWSMPMNCGDVINTEQDELFPTIGAKGELFFSTNGRVGMGGLDLFKAIGERTDWQSIVNMRFPINSVRDDFMFTASTDSTGYFSSNRKGGKGSDDIFSYLILPPPPPPPPVIVEEEKINNGIDGIVINKLTGQPLANATIAVSGNGLAEKIVVQTDGRGRFGFELGNVTECSVKAEKEGFLSDHKNGIRFDNLKQSPSVVILQLDSIILNKPIKIENIYYDSGKWNLKPKSKIELNKLVALLAENPTINIELSSHTDSRSSDKLNLTLSQKRAKTAVDYIVSKGISRKRIVAKGYGETRLLNRCKNGIKCSNAEHQINRRTEMAITSF